MYKIIKDFENYMVDENGNILNWKTQIFKKPTSNNRGKGYLYVDLYNNGKHKRVYIHRLVAQAFIPNPENKPYINHIDGNPRNNNVKNLEWCTPLENVEHASKVLGVMNTYNNSNYKKHLVKLVSDLSEMYSVDFVSIMEKAQHKKIKLSWQYVEVENA